MCALSTVRRVTGKNSLVYLFISSVCIDGSLYVFITYVCVCKHLRVFLSLFVCLYKYVDLLGSFHREDAYSDVSFPVSKGTAVLYRPISGSEGSSRLRITDFKTIDN